MRCMCRFIKLLLKSSVSYFFSDGSAEDGEVAPFIEAKTSRRVTTQVLYVKGESRKVIGSEGLVSQRSPAKKRLVY